LVLATGGFSAVEQPANAPAARITRSNPSEANFRDFPFVMATPTPTLSALPASYKRQSASSYEIFLEIFGLCESFVEHGSQYPDRDSFPLACPVVSTRVAFP